MHEAGIALNIINIVNAEVAARKISSAVSKISVKIGRLSAIIPESLTFHFDVIKKDHKQLSDCALVVEHAPVMAKCRLCEKEFEIAKPLFECEDCHGSVRIISGQEMIVDNFCTDSNLP